MQSVVVFALLAGVAMAQVNTFNTLGAGAGTGAAAAGPALGGPALGAAGAAGGAAAGNRGNPWGPKAYGMGLNNPWALPANPILMRSALSLVQNIPNALVRVDVNGEITITNQFGQEVDIHDSFGNDLSDLYDF